MAASDEVGKASQQFYTALNRMAKGDAGPMAEVWSHSGQVTTMHPIGGREVGWDSVQQPWEQVAQLCTTGEVRLDEQLINATDDMAVETGTERGQLTLAGQTVSIEQRVTNVYRREEAGWKIVHHHTDLSPAMLDILSQPPAQP